MRRPSFWLSLITVASLAVGVLSAALAYLALKEPEPGITFETISDTNVLDVRRPLQDLSIVFRGQDVQEHNLNLRIVTINVVNSGEVDILPSHYDQEDDWGVKFKDGEVIEARLVDTSSEYLRSKVVPQRLGLDAVAFPKVIFEKDAFFAIEILLLHPKTDSPSVSSVGKIAGINEITVLTRPLAREEVSFVTELFQGSPFVQIVRAMIYLLGSVLASIAAVLGLIAITDAVDRLKAKRRKHRILQSRTILQIDQDEIKEFLVGSYESSGIAGLKGLQELTKEPRKLEWVTPSAKWMVRDLRDIDEWITAGRAFAIEHRLIGFRQELDALTAMGVLTRGEDNRPVVDQMFSDVVDQLLSELET